MRATVSHINSSHSFVATIKLSDFNKILSEEFKGRKPSEPLVYFMYERFKKFKFLEGGHDIDKDQQMDILDFLLAMNFLARLVYEKKMRCKLFSILMYDSNV